MASRDADKLPSDTGDLESISGSVSKCGPPDITEEHLPDKTTSTVKAQKSGKFRTALSFFGVRKSMCLLPSFFGGRSKNQSKKGIYKSKTHDGLSQITHNDSLRGDSASTGDFEYCSSDCPEALHGNECCFPSEQKSQSLTRQKRGLKSFFSSFKHHKNHRNDSLVKTEMTAMSPPQSPVQNNPDVTQCLESEPDVPDFANTMCATSLAPECNDTQVVILEKSSDQESATIECDNQSCVDQIDEINVMAVVSSEYKEIASEPRLSLEMMPDPTLKSETPAGSSDQLNLIYSEVASLKSFDSLTGCGDIIADQEVDSITDATVSGERNRNGGKRTSCFLTYQGGGEEMASPEDLDEQCLHDFWETNASEELHCPYNQDRMTSTASTLSLHDMDLADSNSAQQASTINTLADVLTPQSEHQESVPNSDEGYYDSTTPGPDEGQDRTDRLRQTNKLPRDSYSGDALYELFATDESLISPHSESKARLPTPVNVDCKTRYVSMTSDPDLKTSKEHHPEENKPDSCQTVCFSQALVDYEKSSQMLCELHNANVDVLETSSAFTPNMEALPTIVTFDVVDAHNEGEYEEQIHMELEEDISSPYQDFEDSYLQKDAFADYQMLDLYEQSLISSTWAIASLPRHLGLTRLSQSMSNPLSLDRRSRSLDTESLQLQMPAAYRESRPANLSRPQSERDPESDPLAYYKKNGLASEVRDGARSLPWQSRSEMALSLSLHHDDGTQTVEKQNMFSDSFSRGLPDSEGHLHSDVPMSDDVTSQDAELYNRPCHLPLQTYCLPHSTFGYSGIDTSCGAGEDPLRKAAADLHSYMQFSQNRQTAASRERIAHSGSAVPTEDPPATK
ncbi:APC membrane recruitment protein 1 [Syngnathus scovelli]|uniref:APC membrane recruitment protein 1 n=1 Tax=Syngnathus scovelli TaxID=161590 RepID=UPI00210FF93C|nr:APC membrane recruitment protein 1 [Syngnathus scovelli]